MRIRIRLKRDPFMISTAGADRMDHYSDAIMGTMARQVTSLTIDFSTVYSGADQRKHQSSALLAFLRGIHQWLGNSPHKWPVMRKIFPFDDVIVQNHNVDFEKFIYWVYPLCPCLFLDNILSYVSDKKSSSSNISIHLPAMKRMFLYILYSHDLIPVPILI